MLSAECEGLNRVCDAILRFLMLLDVVAAHDSSAPLTAAECVSLTISLTLLFHLVMACTELVLMRVAVTIVLNVHFN